MGGIVRYAGRFLAIAAVIIMTGWAALAIYYSDLPGDYLRAGFAALFAVATLLAFILFPRRFRTLVGFLLVFALIVIWWMTIPASNNRNWQPDVAVLPYATIQGDLVTIHNIRNLQYRTETDFDARYYDKTFDLTRLDSVDLIAVYWMGDAIAHVMMSFGFQAAAAAASAGVAALVVVAAGGLAVAGGGGGGGGLPGETLNLVFYGYEDLFKKLFQGLLETTLPIRPQSERRVGVRP